MEHKFDKSKTPEIILVLVGAFIVFFWIWDKKIFLLLALLLVLISIVWPTLNNYIAQGWMKLGAMIGFVMSKVLLTLVYYICLFPLAIMYRLAKKDFLNLNRKQSSYFTPREHLYEAKDMENIW